MASEYNSAAYYADCRVHSLSRSSPNQIKPLLNSNLSGYLSLVNPVSLRLL